MRGRPRSDQAARAILDAAAALLERDELASLTIGQIASEAGVSKATIYRWWPSKEAVLMDAYLQRVQPRIAYSKRGSARTSLARQLEAVVELLRGREGELLAAIVAAGVTDPKTREAFVDRFLAPRREAARAVLCRGMETGELRRVDVDVATDMLYGPVYFRLLVGHLPLDRGFARELHALALEGLSAPASSPAAGR